MKSNGELPNIGDSDPRLRMEPSAAPFADLKKMTAHPLAKFTGTYTEDDIFTQCWLDAMSDRRQREEF